MTLDALFDEVWNNPKIAHERFEIFYDASYPRWIVDVSGTEPFTADTLNQALEKVVQHFR